MYILNANHGVCAASTVFINNCTIYRGPELWNPFPKRQKEDKGLFTSIVCVLPAADLFPITDLLCGGGHLGRGRALSPHVRECLL